MRGWINICFEWAQNSANIANRGQNTSFSISQPVHTTVNDEFLVLLGFVTQSKDDLTLILQFLRKTTVCELHRMIKIIFLNREWNFEAKNAPNHHPTPSSRWVMSFRRWMVRNELYWRVLTTIDEFWLQSILKKRHPIECSEVDVSEDEVVSSSVFFLNESWTLVLLIFFV